VTVGTMNRELTWPVHRLHYEKNRYIFEQHRLGIVSDELLAYLVREKIADGPLMSMWRRPGYETLCSLAVVTRSNMSFGTVGICRTPLKGRSVQIAPNVLTGCVCCVLGGGAGPLWWNDEVPDIVRDRIADVDPGKASIVEEIESKEREDRDSAALDRGDEQTARPALEDVGTVEPEARDEHEPAGKENLIFQPDVRNCDAVPDIEDGGPSVAGDAAGGESKAEEAAVESNDEAEGAVGEGAVDEAVGDADDDAADEAEDRATDEDRAIDETEEDQRRGTKGRDQGRPHRPKKRSRIT
jgi:bud site selection protein 31